MSPKLIRACLMADPFVPFSVSVCISAGRYKFTVDAASDAALTPCESALDISAQGRRYFVSLAQIATIEFAESAQRSFGFGS